MRVLWFTNIPSPYRLKFFSELGKKVELIVIFEKGYSSERDDAWKEFSFDNYTGLVLKGIPITVDMALSFGFRRIIKDFRNDIIVVSNPITPTGILVILFLQAHRISYFIESDGAFPKHKTGLRGFIKTKLYSKAQYCLTTSELGKQYFMNYGVNDSSLVKYPFSSVLEKELVNTDNILKRKEDYKKKLGVSEEKMVLAVGQFIPRKGFETLLIASKQLNENVGIYLIGGNAGEEYLSLLGEREKGRVHFFPFMEPGKVKEYYLAADVFAFPTHEDIWGLVVNESLSQATPVVSSNKCISGLEMITDGANGFIVDDSNSNQLAKRILDVLYSETYEEMCINSVGTAKKYTIEKMAERHIDIFGQFMREREY